MEIDQIPLFARMIDGRNRTSVRIPIMVANGRRKDMETQEVRSSGQSYHISIKLNSILSFQITTTQYQLRNAMNVLSWSCLALPILALTLTNTKTYPWKRRVKKFRHISQHLQTLS